MAHGRRSRASLRLKPPARNWHVIRMDQTEYRTVTFSGVVVGQPPEGWASTFPPSSGGTPSACTGRPSFFRRCAHAHCLPRALGPMLGLLRLGFVGFVGIQPQPLLQRVNLSLHALQVLSIDLEEPVLRTQ
jgi:hypothetical protein